MDYILYCLSFVYGNDHMIKVRKSTVLGFVYDKTIDYYTGNLIISPLDDKYFIEYTNKDFKKYNIACNSEFYQEAHSYIKGLPYKVISSEDRLLSAYEITDDGTINNITSKVREYYGPRKDFYASTVFEVIKQYITCHELCIIDKNFNIFRFDKDEQLILI